MPFAHFQKGLQVEPDDIKALKYLAWLLATSPEALLRDGAKAVELAQHANVLTGGENPDILHILGVALAEAGRYSEAMQTTQHALNLAPVQSNPKMAGQLQYELNLYQAGKPFHTPE